MRYRNPAPVPGDDGVHDVHIRECLCRQCHLDEVRTADEQSDEHHVVWRKCYLPAAMSRKRTGVRVVRARETE